MRKTTFGELRAHVVGADGDGAGTGPIVVLLHGFGAPGTDLVGLAQEIPAPPGTRFVFPMAPITLERGPEDYVGRAWWMIDMAVLQVAVLTRSYDVLVRSEPEGLARAREAVIGLLDRVQDELGRDAPLFIGGFSQGAMLSTDVVLRTDRAFAGLIVLSGTLIAEAEWTARAPARRGLPVFQSHGREDPILPFTVAEMLRERLRAAELSVEWHAFSGGHGIPRELLGDLGAFLRRHGGDP